MSHAEAGSGGAAGALLVERPFENVVSLTLNRPHRHNAMDWALWAELAATFDHLSGDESVRCIVLFGSGGKAFSTGADIIEFETHRRTRAQAVVYGDHVKKTWDAIIACPHPVVAAIEGLCVGGGLELACLCDMRIASEDSRFGMPLKRLGLVLAYPELQPIFDVAGRANTLEILLEGRLFGTDDALRLGLLSRVAPKAELRATGLDLAASIAKGAPLSARWHKKFIRRLTERAPLTESDLKECFECFDTEDFEIGYAAFLHKSDPTFVGR